MNRKRDPLGGPRAQAVQQALMLHFDSAIGIVTAFVPEMQFLTLLNTGAWDQPMPSAILASGAPVLLDFHSMIMVRPAGLPMSYLYRVLRLPDF